MCALHCTALLCSVLGKEKNNIPPWAWSAFLDELSHLKMVQENVNVTLSRDQTLVTCWDDHIDMLLSWHIDIKFMTVLFEMLSLICIHPHSVSACVVVKEDDYNLYHQKTRSEITGHHLRGPQHLLLLQQTQITSGMKCTSISYLGQRKSHQHHH